MLQVDLHGTWTDAEVLRDVLVLESLLHQLQHLLLAEVNSERGYRSRGRIAEHAIFHPAAAAATVRKHASTIGTSAVLRRMRARPLAGTAKPRLRSRYAPNHDARVVQDRSPHPAAGRPTTPESLASERFVEQKDGRRRGAQQFSRLGQRIGRLQELEIAAVGEQRPDPFGGNRLGIAHGNRFRFWFGWRNPPFVSDRWVC